MQYSGIKVIKKQAEFEKKCGRQKINRINNYFYLVMKKVD